MIPVTRQAGLPLARKPRASGDDPATPKQVAYALQ